MSKITKLDQKGQFIELRAKEMPYEKIGEKLGVSKPTLIKWGKELELEISNLRALEIEHLQDKHCVSKRKRIEFFGKQLDRFYGEFEKRDLESIPTEKLIELIMKTVASLKQEETEIRFKKEGSLEDSLENLNKSFVEWRA